MVPSRPPGDQLDFKLTAAYDHASTFDTSKEGTVIQQPTIVRVECTCSSPRQLVNLCGVVFVTKINRYRASAYLGDYFYVKHLFTIEIVCERSFEPRLSHIFW